ncbi:hypothetical protein ACXNSR_20875 [Streptomyces sp. NC-S4]
MNTNTGRFLAAAASLATLAVGTSAAPAAADDAKTGRVLVVMANFSDRTHPDPAAMRADAINKYFGAGESLTTYYRQVSRGRFTFGPAVKEKVIGPLTLRQKAGCDELSKIREDIEAQVTAKGLVRNKDWDNLSIVLPHITCSWSGMGSIGGRYTWLNTGNNTVPGTTIRHEFGHNLGFPHQPRYQCKDGNLVSCGERAAVAGRSPMGGNGEAGLSSNQLIRTGWMETAEHQRATGSGTFKLRPLYGTQQGIRALEIPMGKQTSLLLEYRRPSGSLDKNLEGVYAYRVTDGAYQAAVPITLSTTDGSGAATELHDKASKVTVKVTGRTADAATVTVSLDGKAPAQGAAPSAAVAPEIAAFAASPQDVADPSVPDGPTEVDETNTEGAQDGGASQAPKAGQADAIKGLASTGSDGTTLTLTAVGGTGLLLGGAFVATRYARSRRGTSQGR